MHQKQESGHAFTRMHTQLRIFHIRAKTECAHFDSPAAEFPPDAVAPAFQRPLARAIPDTNLSNVQFRNFEIEDARAHVWNTDNACKRRNVDDARAEVARG